MPNPFILYITFRMELYAMETIFWPSEMSDFGAWVPNKWLPSCVKLDKTPYDWLSLDPLIPVCHNLR